MACLTFSVPDITDVNVSVVLETPPVPPTIFEAVAGRRPHEVGHEDDIGV
jgi:hypothetical protein